MHALRNSLLGATAFIALLAVVALTADLGVFRPLYEQLASDLLKREVRILGPLEVRLGRHLEVFAEEISISGVVPNGDPFLSVGAASLALQLTTLVDDEITISSATLRDVTLNLDTRHNSNDNQDNPLPTTSPAPDASRPAPKSALAYRLRAHNVSINNADIVWRSETSQQPIVLQVTSLTEELNDTTLVLSSAGLVNGKPYATDLTIRDVESLLVVDDWLIDWAGTIGSATFEAAARLDSLESIGTSELSLSVHADSANQLLATLALPTIEEGPIDIAVALSQQGKRLALNLDALFGEFHFIGDGSIDDVQTFESSHLNLIAEGPSLSHLGSVMGQPNWPETPFEIDIEAAQNGVKIDVPLVMLQSDAVSLSLAGGFADYRLPSTGALDGTIDIPSLGRWGAALALPPELIGPVNGSVSLKRTQGGADIEVRTESPFASLAIAGRLEPGEAMLGSTVSIRGKMDDPDRLLSLMTETSTQLPAATFEGNLSIESPELARVSELRISVGQNELVATGLLGWFSQRYATRIGVSLESDSLQSSVDPFVRNADSVPPLPVLARAMITYRTSQQFSIEEGELQLAGGEGRFSGVLSLTDIKPVLSGDWDLTFPQLQPLLTQFTLPDYLEQPVTFSGHVAWREGQLGISAGQLQFGTALVTGNLLLNQHSKLMQFDLDAQAPDLSLYLPEAMQLQNKPAIPISLRSTGSVTPDAWHLETLQLDSTQAVISGSGLLERDGDEFIDSHLDAEIKIANLSPFSTDSLPNDTKVQHPIKAADSRQQCVVGNAIKVNDVVGDITDAFVEQICHVQPVFTDQCEDMAEHSGLVLVRDGDPKVCGSLELNGREVHRITDIAIFKKCFELVCGHDGAILFGLCRTGPDMGHEDRIVTPKQQGIRKVRHVAAERAGIQCVHQILCDHNFFTGKIHQATTWSKVLQHFSVEQPPGAIQNRQVQADEVTAAQ